MEYNYILHIHVFVDFVFENFNLVTFINTNTPTPKAGAPENRQNEEGQIYIVITVVSVIK